MADETKNENDTNAPAKAEATPAKSDNPQAYLEHCVDCIALPTQFPQSCLGPLVDALQGNVTDAKCVVHCGITLVAWSAGLWIVEHNPHPEAAKAEAVGVPARHQPRAWAADQLAALGAKGDAAGAPGDVGALPWRVIAAIVLDLLKELLNKV
jgi:hypothetical protein